MLRADRFYVIAAYVLAIAVAALCSAHASLYALNADAGFFLETARRVMAGERQYVDMYHYNTPFITYYSMLPVWLAGACNISIPTAFLVFTSAFSTIMALLTLHIASFHPYYGRGWRWYGLAAFLPVLMLFFPNANNGHPFGQREHFFFVLFLPYIFISLNHQQGVSCPRALRLVAGLCAALGCIIKPHFIVFYLASEAVMIGKDKNWCRWRRAESWPVPFLFLASPLFISVFHTEYFTIAALMAPAFGSGYGVTWDKILSNAALGGFTEIVFALMLSWLVLGKKHAMEADFRYVCAMILAGFAVFLVGRAGFQYQALPMNLFFLLLAMLIVLNAGRGHQEKHFFLALVLSGLILLLKPAAAVENLQEAQAQHRTKAAYWQSLQARFHGKSVMVFATAMWPAYPAMNYAGLHDVGASPILFYLPASYAEQRGMKNVAYHPLETMRENERYFFEKTVSDFITNAPDLLWVDISAQKQGLEGMDFDLLDYFLRDPRFAKSFRDYEPIAAPDSPFKDIAYRLYSRKD